MTVGRGFVLLAVLLAADDWKLAHASYEWFFPRDHWAHDGYRTEWWYAPVTSETDSLTSSRAFASAFRGSAPTRLELCDGEPRTLERLRADREAHVAEHEGLRLDQEARNQRHTKVVPRDDGPVGRVEQMLVDLAALDDWIAEVEVDLDRSSRSSSKSWSCWKSSTPSSSSSSMSCSRSWSSRSKSCWSSRSKSCWSSRSNWTSCSTSRWSWSSRSASCSSSSWSSRARMAKWASRRCTREAAPCRPPPRPRHSEA